MSTPMTHQPKRILMLGGGTGGHVIPIINIIHHIKSLDIDAQLYWYGGSASMEQSHAASLVESEQLYCFRTISSGKIRRQRTIIAWLHNTRDMIKVLRGILQSLYFLWYDRIDIIRCKGGYAGAPVIVASYVLGIQCIVHESDTRMGLINRLASYGARQIFTAFDEVHSRELRIGQLLSDDIAMDQDRRQFASLTGLKHSDRPCVLVMGGSQGSQSLYQTLAKRMSHETYSHFDFVVIGGVLSTDLERLFADYEQVVVLDFLQQSELALCYQYADIAITRAGTTSLAEQKLRDIMLVIVPIPRTHDQHTNALRYQNTYQDIILTQDDTLGKQLDITLAGLVGYHKQLTRTTAQRKHAVRTPKDRLVQALISD